MKIAKIFCSIDLRHIRHEMNRTLTILIWDRLELTFPCLLAIMKMYT